MKGRALIDRLLSDAAHREFKRARRWRYKETEMETIKFRCAGGEQDHDEAFVDVPFDDIGEPKVPLCPVCLSPMLMWGLAKVEEPVIELEMLSDNVLGRPVYHTPPGEKVKLVEKDSFPLNEVISVGPGAMMPSSTERYPMTVKVGDLVAVHRVDATLMLNGEVVNFFCESSVRCIVHGEDRSKLTFGVQEGEARALDAKLLAEADKRISTAQPLPGRSFPPSVAKGRRH